LALKPPPKLSEVAPRDGISRNAAWGCVVSNLVLPGLGTFLAHRRVAGVIQLVISQTGFALSLLWAILLVRDWVRQGSFPEDVTPHLALGLIGAAIFLLAWIWSLVSSVEILHTSRKSGL
jgi:TM2 domain-containing membrane protein YozV